MSMPERMYINIQIKWMKAKERMSEFLTSQSGVSNVVATIIILLIVVLLITVFWDRLKVWITDIMDQIFGHSFTS